MGLFTPAWKSKDAEKAINAVNKINDETKLMKIAGDSTITERVRIRAVEKIRSQQFLLSLIVRGESVWESALNKLNAEYLIGVALHFDSHIALSAFELFGDKLDEKTLDLFEEKAKYWKVRQCAKSYILSRIKEETDQTVLINIAGKNPDPERRRAAVENIADEEFLKNIAINDSDVHVCLEAVRRITNEEFLKELALSRSPVRVNAAGKITKQDLLIETVKKCANSDVLEKVVLKIHDQDILYDIAVNNNNIHFIRIMAIKNIDNKNRLLDVFKNVNDVKIRFEVAEKLNDQSVWKMLLFDISKEGCPYGGIVEKAEKEADGFVCKCGHFNAKSHNTKCKCEKCNADNHNMNEKRESVGQITDNSMWETLDIWQECRRCGKKTETKRVSKELY